MNATKCEKTVAVVTSASGHTAHAFKNAKHCSRDSLILKVIAETPKNKNKKASVPLYPLHDRRVN